MDAMGFWSKKSTAFATYSSLAIVWQLQRLLWSNDDLLFYFDVYRVRIIIVVENGGSHLVQRLMLHEVTILRQLDLSFFVAASPLPRCISASRRAYVSYVSSLERKFEAKACWSEYTYI